MSLLDYGQRTDFPSIATITDGETIFTSDTLTFDGATRIMFELFFTCVNCTDGAIYFLLKDNGSDVGNLQVFYMPKTGAHEYSGYGAVFLTPSAGDHEYTIVSTPIDASTATLEYRSWYRITTAPATEIAYIPRTTDLSGTGELITTGSIAFDGATRVRIDLFCGTITTNGDSSLDLLEDAVSIGTFGDFGASETFSGNAQSVPVFLTRFLTPDAGSHVYSVDLNGGAPAALCAPPYVPGFLRITYA